MTPAPPKVPPGSTVDLEESGNVGAPAPDASARRSEAAAKRLGTVLRGKYRLDAVLGIGGMSVVYRAVHRNQAEFAIKMLFPEHAANEELRARFLREGYAANSLKHPGAVRVVDDDVAEDGSAFLVLELLHGIACDELCSAQGGRLPVDAACAIGVQALDVIHAAHVAGIIHRDIKPANLFLLRNGDLKVLDFGIARVRDALATGPHSTGSGVLLGTPAFMAPEQAMGRVGEVDARADIWAVGATLFAMLTGATVHEGDSGRELLVKLVTRTTRSVLEVMPDLPTDVADVVDRALDVDRDERWPSAAAMRDALADAAYDLWEQRSPRDVLSALGASMAPSSRPISRAFSDPQELRRSPVLMAEPTLRAQERPEKPKPSVETARGVSHEGSPSQPRRVSLVVLFALLALGAGVAAIAAVIALTRDGSTQQVSPATGVVPPPTAEPASLVPSVGSAGSVVPAPENGTSPPAPVESAAVPSDVGKAVRPRASTRRDADTTAPAVEALPPVQVPPAASEARPDCNPPFYYDSNSNRVFKKECLVP
jgi:serine/threonine-protein kinase